MKNAISTLLLCTCLLLLVDAGIVSNRDSKQTTVQVDVSQPPSVVQPQSVTTVAPVTPETENVANKPVKDTHDDPDGKSTWVPENQYSIETDDDETDDDDDEVTFETVPNIAPEYWINSEPSIDIPVYKGFVSSDSDYESDEYDSDYETDSIRNVYNQPPPSDAHSFPSSYSFDSEPDLYRSLFGEIRYKLDAIVRRQALILKYIKCSCPDADKCRSPYLEKIKAASWSRDDLTPKQFSFTSFNPYNYFTPPFFSGTPYYTGQLLSALTTLKSAIEKVTVRQNVIYQYAVCSCNKTNACSQKIKPVLDLLFGVDFDLLSPLFPYGSSTFNQFGLGSPEGLFGLGGEGLFNKPNVTNFGSGGVSGSVFSGTIGESSHPSGAYYGTYVSSSSGDRQPPGSGVASSIYTSCVGNAPCGTSGSLGILTDDKKPEVIHLPLMKPNIIAGTNVKPLSSLAHAIEQLNSAASGISASLEGNRPANSAFGAVTSDLVASLSETSRLASELLNRISSSLLGSKPNRTTDDSSDII